MRTVRNLMSFGAFGLIIVLSLVYISSFGLQAKPADDRANYSMDVPEIKGLVVGSSVLLRGVRVGEVTGIRSGIDDATIDFYVNRENKIPVDTDVRLENLSALGEAFVGLAPRTTDGPVLQDGQHIVAEAVTVPPSISELATSVVRVLNQSDPEELKRVLAEADTGLPEPQEVLPNLARTSELLRATVEGMQGQGQQTLANFQTLLRNADWVGPVLADLGPMVGETGLNAGRIFTSFTTTVAWNNPSNMVEFGKFLARIQKFLDDRAPDIKVLTEALLPQFKGIGGALMNFDSGQILDNMLNNIPADGAVQLHVTIPEAHKP
ncbi:mammalian cell entry protein [Mycolicibacterium peregrinum]|uniref:Mammalian cell entry protein n=1 Tax=Mycolicibacterium peregrinum TaxID=43304 RepID=A0A1A0QYK7_MYCPR|nr:MlaD family protein [Mycolicibacterium peregrinum]OBB27167.1 mammalian cell entry protein [Mycolicibacterium peregrinum]